MPNHPGVRQVEVTAEVEDITGPVSDAEPRLAGLDDGGCDDPSPDVVIVVVVVVMGT